MKPLAAQFSRQNLTHLALQVPLQTLAWPQLSRNGLEVIVRRDDLIHPQLSGNKFYKLYFNIQHAIAQGFNTILSFGGAYSNHLHALAAAGNEFGIKTIAVIRGEEPQALSPTLQDARNWGMTLDFVSRSSYRDKTNSNRVHQLAQKHGPFYMVPEGGANLLGALGCQIITQATEEQLNGHYDAICTACGTGSTLSGIASALPEGKKAYGFSILKGSGSLANEIDTLIQQLSPRLKTHPANNNWQLIKGFHGGGYARVKPELIEFIHRFESHNNFKLDPVYTAKMFFAIEQLAQQGFWPSGTRLVVVHSGGLQGRRGYPNL